MISKKDKIYILLLLILLAGCSDYYTRKPDKIPEGQALVYLYLAKEANEVILATGFVSKGFFEVLLRRGEYYYFFTFPEGNIISVEDRNRRGISKAFTFEANRIYYIRCSSYKLEIVSEEIAIEEIRWCRFAKKYGSMFRRD